MDCGDLSDAEWDLIGPLLPPERGRHARPAGDNRRYLNGMLHVLRVGALGATCVSARRSGTRSTSGSGAGRCKASGMPCCKLWSISA
ncbi:transposase [Sphingobium yanoikuyae]|uniref:transposase n=1 Tax=Sphingobium yanoikuyae TaxID=13690 RepID=UPI002E148C9B